ncbi:uncharacterized protein LOC115621653 isoform X2 [Scaptodrosophila lebanonensis]|uniref:Uncharacterized protein LOC115621653 isoform X2 n=1 Tax=Drosophila lebanonensis TaxID=7225 RepID=A0A6J2T8E9_DROLE|nr:uncharacterized protein LOC115621653 isoform X2 [Scaptodrosophila lebanonensis]
MVDSVQCPVCTLYLHAGMNLSDHLETHPKEQVIKALVQMTITAPPAVPPAPAATTASAAPATTSAAGATGKNSALSIALRAAVFGAATDMDEADASADVKPAVSMGSAGVAKTATTVAGTTGMSAAGAATTTTTTKALMSKTGAPSLSCLPPPLSSACSSSTPSSTSSSPSSYTSATALSNNSNNKLNNPPIKLKYEGATAVPDPLAATPTTNTVAAAAVAYQQALASDYRFEQSQQTVSPTQPLHAFQHTLRGSVAAATVAYSGVGQQQQTQQPQHHHYLPQRHAHSQPAAVLAAQQSHYPHQPSLKYAYANSLPPPPPLQLFAQQTGTSQSTQHQKPPPAYGAAISQIRSQHNQNKQQHQQQQQHQQITIHQIAPPMTTATTSKHSSKNTEIFLNPPPPPPQTTLASGVLPLALKYIGEPSGSSSSASSSSSRLQHQPAQQHQQQSQQQHHQQQHSHQSQPLTIQSTYASLLPTSSQSKPSGSGCQSSPARARQSNSPFGALLTAAAVAASASPSSSVLRYAESPVAHYLERDNGDFIVQETPKHIVECVEKEDGEFSVIERIYQSPPSVLHIHDEDDDDDDDDDENDAADTEEDEGESHQQHHHHQEEHADEEQAAEQVEHGAGDSRSCVSCVTTSTATTTKKRSKTKSSKSRRSSKTVRRPGPKSLTADDEECMSVSSSDESEELEQKTPATSCGAPTPLCVAPSTSANATDAASSASNSDANSNNGSSTSTATTTTTKSKKNRITVLSDVPLNMNEYLDLVGNIVASSRIGTTRPFAAIAPIPLVKVEKEEPLDEYDSEQMTRSINETETQQSGHQQMHEDEEIEQKEQKPNLEEQLHLQGQSVASSSSSSHATTSVIRMASTTSAPPQAQLEEPFMKVEVEQTALMPPQRFSAPPQQRGPKKLVIKPKASATTTTAGATNKTNKKTDNSTNNNNNNSRTSHSTETLASTSNSQYMAQGAGSTEVVHIKSENGEPIATTSSGGVGSGSILEKHLTTSYQYPLQSSSRKHTSVNDDDARVLLEFANSKQPLVSGGSSTTFVVNASFPSAGSVFSTNGATAEVKGDGSTTSSHTPISEEYILPDNNLDADEIVISSSSSYTSTPLPTNPQQQHQQQQQQSNPQQSAHNAGTTNPSFNDFNFLYQSNAVAGGVSGSAAGSNFTQFGFQHQTQTALPPSEATNAATLASSSASSSSSAASALIDHDSMNATFRVAKAAREPDHQQQQQPQHIGVSSWYQQATPSHDAGGPQPTNFNAALAAVDCCSVAVDSDASDAKYLDLDACKREQLSGSSNNSQHQLPSASASASTTSSSFAAAATESSLVGGLNIRTDEKMPAKGEISEQESNCDIENSWSQSMYGDISTRFFRNQFSGVYNQMPDWRQDYYPAQDLSSQQREGKRFDFRLPVDVANNSVADYMFPSQQEQQQQEQHGATSTHAKKGKRKPSSAVAAATSIASSSNSGYAEHAYLLDAHPTTSSSSALLAGPPIASTSKAAAAAAAATAGSILPATAAAVAVPTAAPSVTRPPRRKIYKCPHCENIFEKLKERNAHMISEHNYVRQNRRLICTQAALLSSSMAASSTVAAQLFPPQLLAHGSGSSNDQNAVDAAAAAAATAAGESLVEDSKDGIVKIKQEHGADQKLMPSRRDTLNTTLEPMHAKMELPDVEEGGLLVEPSAADIKPNDVVLSELDQAPHIQPLAMTTPAAKLAALYRMLIAYNESKLGQDRNISELEQKAMEKSIFLCYVCRTDFPSVKLYDAHLTEHPAECFTCGKKFYRWKNFSLHLKRHLGWKEFGCYVCDKKFVVRSALVEHMRMHTGQTPLKCKICGKKFKRYSNLTQHRKRHTKMMVRKKEYVCHCGEVLPSKARFLWHKETHDVKPKCCPHCCDRFVHANSLRRHIRLAHSDKFDYAEPMECPMCKQIFAKTSIKAHMATHSTDPQFDCAICNKSFSTKWNLKIHSWVHANRTAKPFKCDYCPKAFVRELDFKNHMNSHKQIKPYTCEYCGCKFIRKYNYMRHRREHHGNKKFTCDQCDKSFHRHYYLIEHRRIHTGERPFQCTICGKSSTTKTNHNKHLKIHHSRDPFTVEV